MSWKNVKDAYKIGHIVQIRDGKICIGSPYVSDLISITLDGVPSWGKLGPCYNDDLARYWEEMHAHLPNLRALIEAADSFARSLPVFTFEGGTIIEKQCEAYDWPNVTHDGCLMYDNSFSADRAQVIKWAKQNAAAGIDYATEAIAEKRKELAEQKERLVKLNGDLEALERLPCPGA